GELHLGQLRSSGKPCVRQCRRHPDCHANRRRHSVHSHSAQMRLVPSRKGPYSFLSRRNKVLSYPQPSSGGDCGKVCGLPFTTMTWYVSASRRPAATNQGS